MDCELIEFRGDNDAVQMRCTDCGAVGQAMGQQDMDNDVWQPTAKHLPQCEHWARLGELITAHGGDNVWCTEALREQFEVEGFSMGMVVVKRKSDGKRGTLDFDHSPRLYYNFLEA